MISALANFAPVLYGMGSAGKRLMKFLDEANISVAYCIDKNALEIKRFEDHIVHLPEYLQTNFNPQVHKLVVSVNSEHAYQAIAKDLMACFPHVGRPLWGRELIDHLAATRCQQRLDFGGNIVLSECMGCRADPSNCPSFRCGAKAASIYAKRPEGRRSSLNDVSFFVTNRCTLNCAHCIEALPYVQTRRTESIESIIHFARKVSEACEFLYRFSITGGEPLLLRDFSSLIDELLLVPNIGFFYIYTTGTVIPDKALCKKLAHPRLAVNISDYGENVPKKLQDNFHHFLQSMRTHGVCYSVLPNKVWFDLGRFEDLRLSESAKRESFSKCSFTNCMTISGHTLFRCPHQLAGVQQNCLKASDGETVDLEALDGESLVDALDRFVALNYIEACGNCRLSTGAIEVTSAIQVPRTRASLKRLSTD